MDANVQAAMLAARKLRRVLKEAEEAFLPKRQAESDAETPVYNKQITGIVRVLWVDDILNSNLFLDGIDLR